MARRLQALIEENHSYLASLGVSHDSLELIRMKCSSAPYNLSTKLTGAGGGGCTVTLVPDSTYITALTNAPGVSHPSCRLPGLSTRCPRERALGDELRPLPYRRRRLGSRGPLPIRPRELCHGPAHSADAPGNACRWPGEDATPGRVRRGQHGGALQVGRGARSLALRVIIFVDPYLCVLWSNTVCNMYSSGSLAVYSCTSIAGKL